MKILIINLLLALNINLLIAQNTTQLPKIGSKLSKSDIPEELEQLCLISSSDIVPCFEKTIDNVTYRIAYDWRPRNSKSFEVRYIATSDPDFKTTEGLSCGDALEISKKDITDYEGWQIHGPITKDGWIPVIGDWFGEHSRPVFDVDKQKDLDWESLGENEKRNVKILYFIRGGG